MKYDENLIYRKHWGGGETFIYDINEVLVAVTRTTGSSIAVYRKEDLPIENVKPGWEHMLWNYLGAPSLSDGWFYLQESVEEGIDRNLHKVTHPNQKIWFEKPNPVRQGGVIYYGDQKVHYTDDDTPEIRQEAEKDPRFGRWYEEPQWFNDLRKEYGPK